jgi:hypothetical protein
MSLSTDCPFVHAELGMTRFPPNVEQVTVEAGPVCVWLHIRRNDITISLPMGEGDTNHLIALLTRARDGSFATAKTHAPAA